MLYSKKTLQIYILCRDRPEYVFEAVNSFMSQLQKDVELIISDNSINSEVSELVSSEFPEITYRRRLPPLSAENHFKKIIEESSSDYLVMFHDDDRVLPGYVDTLLRTINQAYDVSAIALNGNLIDKSGNPIKFSSSMVSCGFSGGIRMMTAKNLVDAYFSPRSCGIAPFAGYAYNKKYLSTDLVQSSDGGKHADVSLLIKLSETKPILWLESVLQESRRHDGNDSAKENIHHRLSLKKYLIKRGLLIRKTKVFDFFRYQYWFFWWLQNEGVKSLLLNDIGWRKVIIRRFIVTKSIIFFIKYNKLRKAFLRKFIMSLF